MEDQKEKVKDTERDFEKRHLKVCQECHKEIKIDSKGYHGKFCKLKTLLPQLITIAGRNFIGFRQYTAYKETTGHTILVTEVFDLSNVREKPKIKSEQFLYGSEPDKEDTKDGPLKHLQKKGMAFTYLRRYALYTVFNFFPEEDTDGNIRKKQSTTPYAS